MIPVDTRIYVKQKIKHITRKKYKGCRVRKDTIYFFCIQCKDQRGLYLESCFGKTPQDKIRL